MTRRTHLGAVVGLVAIVSSGLLAGCGIASSPDPSDPNTLEVLAGSEVKDLEPMLPDIKSATGVTLVMSYSGSLDGAEAIAGGASPDVAWFSSGHYLSLLPGAGNRVVAQTKIMLSPVIIGVKKSVADRFGWTNNPNVTWKDIEAKAADGSFHFAMTNPAASNSGLVALIGVASALSGSSDSIDTGTIDTTALTAFFKGQVLTAGSSGFLADSYVRDQDTVDGIVNYESVLMSLDAGGQLHEPLTLIYPKEGIVTADYPFMLLNASKQAAYDKVTAYLRTPDVQKRIMTDTARRPAIPGVPLDSRFPTQTLIELPFPAKLDTINALITTYLDQVRKPASAIFVLDLSGSMAGDRLAQLQTAMKALTGLDSSLTGQFARFRAREEVTIITFATDVLDTDEFTIDDTAPDGPDMTAIRAYVDGLQTDGSTAIYSALEEAYRSVATQQAADPDRLYSIVLMTDGENNAGVDPDQFAKDYAALPGPVRDVHIYPVLFGEASKDAMTSIATLTGGTLFDATTTSLETIFKQIRGLPVAVRRFEAYLYSRRNIVASALALAGVALHLVGLVAGLEWLPITVGLYLIGALLVPAEQGLALQLGAAQDASDVRGSLNRLLGQLRGKVADDLYAKVVNIQGSILATLAAEGDSGDATDPNVYLIRQTALAYLPEAFATYLRMPRLMAERRAIAGGRTPHDVLLDQLSLMDSRLADVADDIARHDSDKLLANGRFIAEKFAVSSLRVPAEAATVAVPEGVAAPVAEPVAEQAEAATERERVPLTDEAQAVPGSPGGGSPGLDLAFSWLQRSLDELTEATRRTEALATPATAVAVQAPAPTPQAVTSPAAPPAEPAPPSAPGTKPTPLLDQIGRDLTKLAAQGLLAPVLGRDAETEWMIEVLLRGTKRNPVLLGPAGVGKTAIVEGLAQRIVAGRVPGPLLGARIVEVPLAALTAGTQYRGQLEERVTQLVAEASQPGLILFFDEIHLLAAAGRTEGGIGAGEILKPALSRGDIAVIGATTPEDYRTTIALDEALARRFTTVTVNELDKAATRPILMSVRDALAKSRGVAVSDDALDVLLDFADRSIANRRFPDKAIDLLQQAVAHALVVGATTVDRDAAVAATVMWAARATSTPTLARFGRDLVALAKDGKLGPIVGRERELDAIVEVLLRQTKRNPLLLGPAGAGKTAVVEGLALRIAAGAVPEPLRDVRIFDVPLLSLAAGITAEPPLLGDLLVEVSHPSVVVFFDEIHLLASPTVRDLAESLKPPLARGEIACIGATTAEEYQADLESETALARRFTEIDIEPMDPAAVRAVLVAVRDHLAKLRGIPVTDEALDELVALADQYLPNRAFPDKGVDLIEQSVAYAMTHGQTTVDVAVARDAVAALIGMPLDPSAALAALATELRDQALLEPAAATALLGRLGVSLRGLDARPERPDAVVLLCDGAAVSAGPLAATLARVVLGRETAVIDIDLAGLTDDSSISTLLGSAPGLIGSDRQLPLHELRRSPWQVVVLRSVDACAFTIRETIAAALAAGAFTDAMGRRIPLGAAMAVLTAPVIATDGEAPAAALLAARLGPALIAVCDVISGSASGAAADARADWIRRELLGPLVSRLSRAGYAATFDPAFVAWLDQHLPTDGASPEDYLDQSVTPLIVRGLPGTAGPVRIGLVQGAPAVIAAPTDQDANGASASLEGTK